MSVIDTLPVLLVSAVNETAANELIDELIDNDVTEEFKKDDTCTDRVWKLVNKYYSANVRVHALADGAHFTLPVERVEAHVVHLTQDEAASAECVRARADSAAWRRAAVRVLAPDAPAAPALRAWAARARADLVPLREAADEAGDAAGVRRVRAALHAHVWPGLRRAGGAADEAAAEAVERAEQFAAALGALRCARDSAGAAGAGGAAGDGARRAAAEALLRAFCRALGDDPDDS